MAIAGGACSAYRVQVIGNELSIVPTTALSYQCAPLVTAITKLSRGEWVTVRGSEMVALRNNLRAHGIWCEDAKA